MSEKPTYQELEDRNKALEQKIFIQKMDLESLRLEEERYRALTENTSDWLWEVDQDSTGCGNSQIHYHELLLFPGVSRTAHQRGDE